MTKDAGWDVPGSALWIGTRTRWRRGLLGCVLVAVAAAVGLPAVSWCGWVLAAALIGAAFCGVVLGSTRSTDRAYRELEREREALDLSAEHLDTSPVQVRLISSAGEVTVTGPHGDPVLVLRRLVSPTDKHCVIVVAGETGGYEIDHEGRVAELCDDQRGAPLAGYGPAQRVVAQVRDHSLQRIDGRLLLLGRDAFIDCLTDVYPFAFTPPTSTLIVPGHLSTLGLGCLLWKRIADALRREEARPTAVRPPTATGA